MAKTIEWIKLPTDQAYMCPKCGAIFTRYVLERMGMYVHVGEANKEDAAPYCPNCGTQLGGSL